MPIDSLPSSLILSWLSCGIAVFSWQQAKVPSWVNDEKQTNPFQMFQPMALIYGLRTPKYEVISFTSTAAGLIPGVLDWR